MKARVDVVIGKGDHLSLHSDSFLLGQETQPIAVAFSDGTRYLMSVPDARALQGLLQTAIDLLEGRKT